MNTRTRLIAWGFVATLATGATGATPKFFDDDPLMREPETQDASAAVPYEVGLFYEMSVNLFVTPRHRPANVKAGNVNTIDEVPDSSWFTNRIGVQPFSVDDVMREASAAPRPVPERWTIIHEKESGFAPGFRARDANGETWFISFDPPRNPEGASSGVVIATAIFRTLGYNTVENHLTTVSPENVSIDPSTTMHRPSGEKTPMTARDLAAVYERAARNADGSYRVAAGRLVPGKILGDFLYEGTRSDDPNDLVPHEQRRELRALRVFGAWVNLTDMKAGNTLDTLITQNGRSIIKHYLQDVGSTFGMGANGPHEWSEGWEHLYERGPMLQRLGSFGFVLKPWQTARYREFESVGRFEGEEFDPTTWKPRAPTTAYLAMRPDDAFWAARRVMAFDDDLVRAIVKVGQFSDPAAEQYVGDVLIKRRDKIGRAYLTAINPIVDPAFDGRVLTFGNTATQYRFAEPPDMYRATWHRFDNATGATTRLAETTAREARMEAPASIPETVGSFIRIDLSAPSRQHASWSEPIHVYFRRIPTGWKLVGLERHDNDEVTSQRSKVRSQSQK